MMLLEQIVNPHFFGAQSSIMDFWFRNLKFFSSLGNILKVHRSSSKLLNCTRWDISWSYMTLSNRSGHFFEKNILLQKWSCRACRFSGRSRGFPYLLPDSKFDHGYREVFLRANWPKSGFGWRVRNLSQKTCLALKLQIAVGPFIFTTFARKENASHHSYRKVFPRASWTQSG